MWEINLRTGFIARGSVNQMGIDTISAMPAIFLPRKM